MANYTASFADNPETLVSKLLKRKEHPAAGHPDPVMLKEYPAAPERFRDDVRPWIGEIRERHGEEEWNAGVLSMELHRHMGIYNIIGTKMGIRAREILGADYDALRVVSWAGSRPPVSCMNDGLQTSTGASLGRGTIEVVGQSYMPKADFIFGNKFLTLSLKNETEEKVSNALKDLLKKHNGLNSEYFFGVREISMVYWLELDRKEIFSEYHRQETEDMK
jgi:pyrimidine-specific ribonucleoside hydrolase